MKIALFGATGHIGTLIAQEALARGHEVTGIVRTPPGDADQHRHLHVVAGDVTDPARVAEVAAGHDVMISAVSPGPETDKPTHLADAARSLHEGLKRAGVKRLVVLGGAGSLEDAPGKMLMDSPDFPSAWRPTARAHYEALKVYRAIDDLDWTYLSPADRIEPGPRTGRYRTGLEQVVRNAAGKSIVSPEDLAAALLDEVEHPQHLKQRFTIAY
jgi:uncharacterized protein